MLGKLLKHEWKQTWKLPTFTCIATIIVTLVGMLSFFTPLWDNDSDFLLTFTGFTFLFLNIVLLIASSLTIFVYFSIRFYKNLYTDEGYLMHTLPVTSRQLIFSKFWVFFAWTILNGILVFICATALMLSLDSALDLGMWNAYQELFELFKNADMQKFFANLNEASLEATGLPAVIIALLYLFLIFISLCQKILTPYFAISIGQLFSKFKLAASIGMYIAILIVQQIVSTIIALPINMSLMLEQINQPADYSIKYFYMIYGPQFILILVMTALFYFFTHKLMKKHLNLD